MYKNLLYSLYIRLLAISKSLFLAFFMLLGMLNFATAGDIASLELVRSSGKILNSQCNPFPPTDTEGAGRCTTLQGGYEASLEKLGSKGAKFHSPDDTTRVYKFCSTDLEYLIFHSDKDICPSNKP